MKDEIYNTGYGEMETIINIDYARSEVSIYTSKKGISKRLEKKIGQPTKKYYTNGKISSTRWDISFSEAPVRESVLSYICRGLLPAPSYHRLL